MVDFEKLINKPEMTEEERDELWKPWRDAHKEDIEKLNRKMGIMEDNEKGAAP